MSDFDTLSRRQRRFVRALLTAPNVRAAAGIAGISEATAWRWLRLDSVQAAASELQDTLLADATRHATGLLTEALDTLAGIMRDNGYSASARVGAARAILETGLRYSELIELARRVEVLEQRLEVEQ